MAEAIQFDEVPGTIRKPGQYMEFNTRLAVNTLPGNVQKVLIIAPISISGTAEPLEPVGVYSDIEADELFGASSLAAAMVRAAIRANSYMQLDVIGLAEPNSARAASCDLTIAGTVTRAGTLSLLVAGQAVSVSVEVGEKPDSIYSALIAEMALIPELLVTAELVTEEVEGADDITSLKITAKAKGAWTNEITLSTSTTTSGLAVTLSAFEGGENDADIQPALDAVFAAGHNIVICPFSTSAALSALSEHLKNTGNAIEQRGAVGIAGHTGTLGAGVTLATGVNDGRISVPWYRGSVLPPAILAACYGAVMAGEEDPARPLNTLELTGMDVVAMSQREGRNEQETALMNGLTPIEVGPGNTVQIVRAISTYTVNAQGVTDVSLLDITSIRTLDYVRKACRERIALRFPREKLSTRTPPKVKSELYDVLLKLEDAEIIENVEANLDKLIVQKNGTDANRLDSIIPSDVVNGLHVSPPEST